MNSRDTGIDPDHICRYSDWGGDRRICRVCSNAEDFKSDWGLDPKELQPQDTNGNSRLQLHRRRQFTDLEDGLTVRVDTETAIDIPTSRAEWRRRKRDATKQPKHPVLLDSRTIDFSEEPPSLGNCFPRRTSTCRPGFVGNDNATDPAKVNEA